ncbi:tRNA (N6-threonylcarbamoyladenosine(37)-N6)-methyltransferase TrmO [Acidimangrovimonas pyrenivorans]|uniref:tRNA (N6-threonylcarbamoyladenosine(37)-N6)-methyltransferase TrmO n=1 Tax=Acidimangrovimonas pyrenivorans TaxID=2030798 RepID=A0ABV7ACK5_9RHOB
MTEERNPMRPGEVALAFDPAERAEAGITFIGRLRTPWKKGDCPRNLRKARERGGAFSVELDPAYRDGLTGLEPGQAIILLYWMNQARRDLIVQTPGHADGPRGTFALRSPVRPNPVSLATVRITALELEEGRISVDALDCFDGTPLVDIKPWRDTIDVPPTS